MRLLEHIHLSRQERGVDFVRITLWKRAGGIFWEGGVDSVTLAYRCLKEEYILGGWVGFRECPTVAYGCLKEGIFWEGGVDYGRDAYLSGGGAYSGRAG